MTRTTDTTHLLDPRLLSRRALLVGGGAAIVGAALPGRAGPRAQGNAKVHAFMVGAARLTVLSDGTMAMPFGFVLPGRTKAEIAAAFASQGRAATDPTELQVNVAVIRLGSDLILVDAGAGADFAPARGKLTDNLAAAGIKPEQITKVVFTHAHPDHLWGITDPFDGASIFTNARHYINGVERDFWLRPDIELSMPEAIRGVAIGTRRRLRQLGDRLEAVRIGAEIVPGLALVDSAGHTPGHASVLLRSGSEQLLIGGDVLTHATLSFARPHWRWGADWDADMGVSARRRVLDMLATDRIGLLGYHLTWPGVGRVERRQGLQDSYSFVQS